MELNPNHLVETAYVDWGCEVFSPEDCELPEGIRVTRNWPTVRLRGPKQALLRFTRDYLMLADLAEARKYLV